MEESIHIQGDKKERYNSIDIFRGICAILVVAIHTEPFYEINEMLGYYFTEVISRVAVPFFFCVSGFFLFKEIEQNGLNISVKKTFVKMLKIYLFWSVIYTVISIKSFLKVGLNIKGIIVSVLEGFLLNGAYYHLWYFVALLICIILTIIVYEIHIEKYFFNSVWFLYVIGLMGSSYYKLGNNIPMISTLINSKSFEWMRRVFFMGIPFFVLGYFVNKYVLSVKNSLMKLMISLLLYFVEVFILNKFDISTNIIISVSLYFVVGYLMCFLVRHPLVKAKKCAVKIHKVSNWTYYIHPLVIVCIQSVWGRNFENTKLFITVCIVCVITGALLTKCDNKIIKQYLL